MENKLVHVPQGKSARLERASLSYGFTGLYTDGFSSCNILAFIGSSKLILIHADVQTDPTDEYFWIKDEELQEVVLIYRPEFEDILTVQLRPTLQEKFGAKLRIIAIEQGYSGIQLSFDSNQEDFHEYIKRYSIGFIPSNLLRHPLEQQLVAVQKIEQLIGMRAKVRTGKSRKRYLNVFDVRVWTEMVDNELLVDKTHLLTKKEMGIFSPEDDYIVVEGKLRAISKSIEAEVPMKGSADEIASTIAPEMEGYLNNFDASRLFRRNIHILFDTKAPTNVFLLEQPVTQEDRDLVEKANKEDTVEGLVNLFGHYDAIAEENAFKKDVMAAFTAIHEHYQERMIYANAALEREKLKKRFARLTQEGAACFRKKEFKAATTLFHDALNVASHCLLKDDPLYAIANWNLGRTAQRIGQWESAEFFIGSALTLREVFQKEDKELIAKTSQALKECKDMIKKTAVTTPGVMARKGLK